MIVAVLEDKVALGVHPGDHTARRPITGFFGLEREVRNIQRAVAYLGFDVVRSLVMLNGRRMAASGIGTAVDINDLPQKLIERVEIITGGASTVYGSDAVAGVINFITRNDFDGFAQQVRYFVDVAAAYSRRLKPRGMMRSRSPARTSSGLVTRVMSSIAAYRSCRRNRTGRNG